ncbi:envelope membrane protein [[Leptolyngbya] sp. PCC 7376]|uniref:proton extrusion protein PcxA n=1 Tax=[Leptolyngbya] sp. PCC 7376 TaxID=111781 RepID=UPI00029EDF7D|nr:proton extrusion protein PcxA [[Leptolyngbya] sp. PCC 7376]AFY37179.1 envelope membrane protein [[Leptolyngbya] sp. PCC 7376]
MKFNTFVKKARSWFYDTPDRALDQAYRAVLTIKAIEDEHFQGKVVSSRNAEYSDSVINYFQSEVRKQLKLAQVRLREFRSFKTVIAVSEETINKKSSNIYYPEVTDKPAIVIEKLRFIDEVTERYGRPLSKQSVALINVDQQSMATMSEGGAEALANERQKADTAMDKTGLVPRSIVRTFGRIQQEIDPKSQEAEEDVVKKFRRSRNKTAVSIKFLLMLVIIPLLVHQLSKIAITPFVEEHFFTEASPALFANTDLEDDAFEELEHYRASLEMRSFVGLAPTLDETQMKEKIKEKAGEIAVQYRDRSFNAYENIFADICSFFAFVVVLIFSQREIAVLKSFLDEVIYGLSDSAKAFLIILFTDIFVGYHSPHGWEIVLESVAKHFGIAESRDFNFLFIATFPVILDTVLKYWIFRYLNRISPSAVATYRNMNE